MGPLLFICYIYDMPEIVHSPIAIGTFTDDSTIVCQVQNVVGKEHLQFHSERFHCWADK